MLTKGYLSGVSREIKLLVTLFLVVLSVGYGTAFLYINTTTSAHPRGIVENYNGNEDDEEADEMKFKKSHREMLSIIHTHILGMSIIFFVLAILVYGTCIPSGLRFFLMIEPLLSVLLTFGGIYMVWLGVEWFSYVVMLSGILMSLSYVASLSVVMYTLWFKM